MDRPERTFTERILIEILFQLINTSTASDGYIRKRLKLVGVTDEEIDSFTE